MSDKVINYSQCMRCKKEWVRDEAEIFCPECIHDAVADLAVRDILANVTHLKKCSQSSLFKRMSLLSYAVQELSELVRIIDGGKK